ncbi:MAG TPA: endonuclease/exonuclease/phosphatase family protein [Rubrobacteraceae bacterium]|nr:endonuclease/exonuclease/phosphatase family protein [Rubrobacteraceae bacterium]
MPDTFEVITYNAWCERGGRDPLLDDALEDGAIVCLQEVKPRRALELKRRFGKRAFVSPGRHGLQYIALVLPRDARFVRRRTVQLNGIVGLVPRRWSLRRGAAMRRAGRPGWRDCFEPRVAQEADVEWRDRRVRVVNTHVPYAPLLRDPCLGMLAALTGEGDAILAGDLNAPAESLHLNDLVLATGLRTTGMGKATHGRHKIDHVLVRGPFREAGYRTREGKSDHRLLKVVLEVNE